MATASSHCARKSPPLQKQGTSAVSARGKSRLILGTRPSRLARQQTDTIAEALRSAWPGLEIQIMVYTTQGDRVTDRPLLEIGGKGLFTAEIEAALRSEQIDLAVHSLKDLPITEGSDLVVGAVPERAPAHDVLVSRHRGTLDTLPATPRIGTSSLRRAAQIRAARPDAQVVTLRGNLDTRLRKAATDDYDGVVLAAAGIIRLGLEVHITQHLPFDVMLPAPAQGALAVQCRADDAATLALIRPIHHPPSWAAVTAERAFLSGLGGGCSAPVAAYAQPLSSAVVPSRRDTDVCFRKGDDAHETLLWVQGLVASLDGQQIVRVAATGWSHEAEQLGQRLAQEALHQGAGELR